ncbi:MAG TPA: PIG-L family deacetylase [Candidatus Nitrosotalea sp.]|nr:PIG-L family deacetylase [Candidatus Nitrosotalea sp.]
MKFLDLSDKKIVVLGAHPDDIELGMGGTLYQIRKYKPKVIIFSDSTDIKGNSRITGELKKSMAICGIKYQVLRYRTMDFVNHIAEIRNDIYKLRDADVVFCTSKNSQHLDHRILGEAVDDIMFGKTILYYEDIRSGQNQHVNCWNELTEAEFNIKCKMIEQYTSQRHRIYFRHKSFSDLVKFRGAQIEGRHAEAFELQRLIL